MIRTVLGFVLIGAWLHPPPTPAAETSAAETLSDAEKQADYLLWSLAAD